MLAFQLQSGQFIYFDAITRYDRRYSSSVSKHPISKGTNITDNITRENPEFTFSAYVSNGAWSNSFVSLGDEQLFASSIVNPKKYVPKVSVSLDTSTFTKYLPDSLTQFFNSGTSTIILQDKGDDRCKITEDFLINIRENEELFTLYEFDSKGNIRKSHENVTLTNLSFNEDPDTGDGLNIEVSVEKIFLVEAKSTTIPKDVAVGIKDKSSGKEKKGQVGPGVVGGDGKSPPPAPKPSNSIIGAYAEGKIK